MIRFVVLLALLAAARCPAQAACTERQPGAAAAQALRLDRSLQEFKLGETDDTISAPAQQLLQQFKAALAETATAVLACDTLKVTPTQLEQRLATLLEANQPASTASQRNSAGNAEGDAARAGILGTGVTVHASLLSQTPPVLAVRFGFGIPCGDDNQLLLFVPSGNRWREVLRWQAPPYDTIRRAFGDFFQYGLLHTGTSPADWRLVVAHGEPWCTSRWSGFGIDLLGPGKDPTTPRVLWQKNDGYVRFDTEPKLTTLSDTFTLRLELGTVETEQMTRPGIYRYRVVNDHPERIGPLADNGRYFVDEWVQMPWAEAARFADPAALDALKDAHDRYAAHNGGKDPWTYSYGAVQRCHDDPKHFQVTLNVDDAHTGTRASYYGIEEITNGYRMLSADRAAPAPECTGPDLMKPH